MQENNNTVQFHEEELDPMPASRKGKPKKPSGLTGLLIASGVVKEKRQADMVLLGVAVLFFFATAIVLFVGNRDNAGPLPSPPTPEQLQNEL